MAGEPLRPTPPFYVMPNQGAGWGVYDATLTEIASYHTKAEAEKTAAFLNEWSKI